MSVDSNWNWVSDASSGSTSTGSLGGFGTASMAMSLGGLFSSVIGGFYNAKSQKSQLKSQALIDASNARIADANTRIAELGAQSALSQGQQQVGALTLKSGQLKSSQRAALAANGVDLGEGNAAEIQASTDIMKEIDTNTLQANAVRSAWGYRTLALNYQNKASNARVSASTKQLAAGTINPLASAGASLMGSAGSVASNWYMLNKSGALQGSVFEIRD